MFKKREINLSTTVIVVLILAIIVFIAALLIFTNVGSGFMEFVKEQLGIGKSLVNNTHIGGS